LNTLKIGRRRQFVQLIVGRESGMTDDLLLVVSVSVGILSAFLLLVSWEPFVLSLVLVEKNLAENTATWQWGFLFDP
jgi:hypothetical protein